MKVFFDASVIIAALLSPNGGSAQLFKYITLKKIIGITSQTVIEEILEEEKFIKISKSREEIEKFIAGSGLIVRKSVGETDIEKYRYSIDIEDAHLVAGANLTKCDYLVSLDQKHVLRQDIKEQFLPLKIVSPGDLLEIIVST